MATSEPNLPNPTDDEAERITDLARSDYDDHLDAYRDAHGAAVCETRTRIVFADESGNELNEWSNHLGIDREKILAWMHEKDGSGYDWSHSDPVVLLKERV